MHLTMRLHNPWRNLVAEPVARDHFVQVYRDEAALLDAVSLFTVAAIGRNDAVVLVATPEHGEAVRKVLDSSGLDPEILEGWGQLQVHDAEALLTRFMVDGEPHAGAFQSLADGLIGSARASGRFRHVRVYGEMVNLLWGDNLPAAVRLEQLWNEVIEEHSISLFCAYGLEPVGPLQSLPRSVKRLHTHFIPLEGCA